ncbi:prepilin-type N-terminal cleavage/methylation domain-containing protein [Desulfonauticus submarinus]|uniref:Prepilin-type N-terminal cleavage/methylation domain-containing protein n=1 Tax=Desulfonauticus submarinus TaxID=206665 RepID=A0A1H0DJE6_9BACT|nr:type II secretion system protein [Desulfonauticus submarinus]SDN70272.1 prepilin-type N-terminal cleavage/methylation domain-containing protein [Desulfonauticus submarinus]
MNLKKNLYKIKGFSLIELILTLVIAGILGAILFTLTSSHPLNSVQPLILLKKEATLINAMETVNAKYRNKLKTGYLDLDSFKNEINIIVKQIDPKINTSSYYILFDNNHQEIKDLISKRILKVELKKDDLIIVNIFTK